MKRIIVGKNASLLTCYPWLNHSLHFIFVSFSSIDETNINKMMDNKKKRASNMFHSGLFLFYNVNVEKYKNIVDPKTNDGKHLWFSLCMK